MSTLVRELSSNEMIDTSTALHCTKVTASLNNLITNGIVIDKNLRQPTFYSKVNFNDLKVECFTIITDMLTNQQIPLWLSQRIGWYYANKYYQEIITDLSINVASKENSKLQTKIFSREELVVYLRNQVSLIIKEWLNEKSKLFQQNIESLMFSLTRTDSNTPKCLTYFECGIKNKRRIMEDRTAIYENINIFHQPFLSNCHQTQCVQKSIVNTFLNRMPDALVAVFDGHCGSDCAQYVSSHLPMTIIQNSELKLQSKENYENSMERILRHSFTIINERFTEKAVEENLKSGSTACVCLLTNNESKTNINTLYSHLTVAWCGDTQFCLVKNGQIAFLTEAHKPNNENEKIRIEQTGGSVAFISNAWRLNGSLSVARSFGDVEYQAYGLTAEPEVLSFELDGTEDYFIVGCDGLWDTLNLNELCKIIYDQRENVNIAEYLVKLARENGSTDNITAVVVALKESLSEIAEPIINI